jgi:surface protein
MPSGEYPPFNGKAYRVVYNKKDAFKFADTACTSNINNMNSFFHEKYSFNKDISHWDVSNVTEMTQMFYRNSVFNQDISHWDVSNVENMYGMFHQAYDFNQDIGLEYKQSKNNAIYV